MLEFLIIYNNNQCDPTYYTHLQKIGRRILHIIIDTIQNRKENHNKYLNIIISADLMEDTQYAQDQNMFLSEVLDGGDEIHDIMLTKIENDKYHVLHKLMFDFDVGL